MGLPTERASHRFRNDPDPSNPLRRIQNRTVVSGAAGRRAAALPQVVALRVACLDDLASAPLNQFTSPVVQGCVLRRWMGIGFAALGCVACAHAAPTQAANADDRDPQRHHMLDECLYDGGEPLDPPGLAAVRATWVQWARKEAPSPIEYLRGFGAGPCTAVHWQPVTPGAFGVDSCPRTRTLFMPEVGSVVVDLTTKAASVSEAAADVTVLPLDARRSIVTHQPPGAVAVELVTRGDDGKSKSVAIQAASDGAGVRRVIDARRIVLDGDVVDVVSGERLHVPSADVFVPSAIAPMGIAVAAGIVYSMTPWRAFLVDGRGRELAHLGGVAAAVFAMPLGAPEHEQGAAIASFDDATRTLTVVTFVDGKVERRSAKIDAGPLDAGHGTMWLRGAGTRDTLAFGLADSIIAWKSGAAAPVVFRGFEPPPSSRGAEAIFVLAQGRVIIATSDRTTLALDATTGGVLAQGATATTRFTSERALFDDRTQPEAMRATVVSADASVRRGRLGTTVVGRFSLATWIDVVDPWLRCDAEALSALPPIVRYPMQGRPRGDGTRMRGDAYAFASVLRMETPPIIAIGPEGFPAVPAK
ncbi:hypothetical protein BH09MYX1_BH09MYX1_16210 [soil metagenome]